MVKISSSGTTLVSTFDRFKFSRGFFSMVFNCSFIDN